ncbi:MAG: hypothetical protein QOD99_1279 [Chthoniobacter sp.]|nr:hypothetical protein [Chthoniobacter sp.]
MKSFLLTLIVAVLAITLPTGLFASTKSSPLSSKKKKIPVHHDTLISSVSANSITITENKTTKTFGITPATEIDVRGQRAGVGALQPGMMVSITIGMNAGIADRISAGDAPVHHDQQAKKKK